MPSRFHQMTVAAVVKRIVGRNVVGGASVSFVVHVVAALVAATSAAVKSNTPPPARGGFQKGKYAPAQNIDF